MQRVSSNISPLTTTTRISLKHLVLCDVYNTNSCECVKFQICTSYVGIVRKRRKRASPGEAVKQAFVIWVRPTATTSSGTTTGTKGSGETIVTRKILKSSTETFRTSFTKYFHWFDSFLIVFFWKMLFVARSNMDIGPSASQNSHNHDYSRSSTWQQQNAITDQAEEGLDQQALEQLSSPKNGPQYFARPHQMVSSLT